MEFNWNNLKLGKDGMEEGSELNNIIQHFLVTQEAYCVTRNWY